MSGDWWPEDVERGRRVAVAMSGGVDSSTAAALLMERGYEVVGFTALLWGCCGGPDVYYVAKHLGIRLYTVDFTELFKEQVVNAFVAEYLAGRTPNPCMICNRRVRFGPMLDYALAHGADFMATGHYARIRRDPDGMCHLLRGVDDGKDQSYVLALLTQGQIRRLLLPIGDFHKSQVRRMARERGIPVAEKRDSQDLCFMAGGDYRELLRRLAPDAFRPGPIVTRDGRVLGEHSGLPGYTVGQRKGLGLSDGPYYVLELDAGNNALIVGRKDELLADGLIARDVNWIAGEPPSGPIRAGVKIRYRAPIREATVTPLPDGKAEVVFDRPPGAIAPGQGAVFYRGEECLGGGMIVRAFRAEQTDRVPLDGPPG